MDESDRLRFELGVLLGSGRELSDRVRSDVFAAHDINETYQAWYTQARRLVAQVLPDRLREFEEYYRSSCLGEAQPVTISAILAHQAPLRIANEKREGLAKLFDPGGEQQVFQHLLGMQLGILASALPTVLAPERPRDRELAVARALLKEGHRRAAGALAGVALDRHLLAVARRRGVELEPRAARSVARLDRALREAGVYGEARSRYVRSLARLSDSCVRGKDKPSRGEVCGLLAGVDEVLEHVH
jgi:hypothetical protein